MVFYKCDQCTHRSLKKTKIEEHKLETVHNNVREKVSQMQQLYFVNSLEGHFDETHGKTRVREALQM